MRRLVNRGTAETRSLWSLSTWLTEIPITRVEPVRPGHTINSTRAYPVWVIVVAVVLFVLAVAVGGVAVAGLIGKLPRNRWAGVRTEDSLRSDESFALANKVAGPTMLAAAGMLVIGGVAALTIGGVFGVAVAIIAVVVAVLTAGFGGGIGARAAAALPQQSGCGNDCNCGGHSEPAADEPVAETPDAKANAAACGTASCGACALKDACQPAH